MSNVKTIPSIKTACFRLSVSGLSTERFGFICSVMRHKRGLDLTNCIAKGDDICSLRCNKK